MGTDFKSVPIAERMFHRRTDMSWRLLDVLNNQWYNDEVYESREDCVSAADYYMRLAQSEGEVLELLPELLTPTEETESFIEEEANEA
jgi:hypothetical protein